MVDECKEIRPECEHRLTKIETIIANELPHMAQDIATIKRLIYALITALCTGVLGLVFTLIRGHFKF